MIKVYTKPSCPQCEATKRELAKKGLEYYAVDVTADEHAFNEVVSLGYRQMPVVVTENAHWSGFQVDKLDLL